MLVKAFGDEPGLVVRDGAIRVTFDLKHPLVANDIVVRLARNQVSRTIRHESVVFNGYILMLVWNFESLRDTVGFRFKDAPFSSGFHGVVA